MKKFHYSKLWYLVGALLVANIAAASLVAGSSSSDHGLLYFFDVGQGDAIYYRTSQGNDVLIDGGPHDKVLSKLGRVMPFADRRIELMVLTHPHADHVSGLIEVLKRYEVERIMFSEAVHSSRTYQSFLQLASEEGAEIIHPQVGQRFYLDSATVLDVLYPFSQSELEQIGNPNDASTVMRLSFGESNVIFTADADQQIESDILGLSLPVEAEILKVGHQGSRTSSSFGFLESIKGEYAVITVGKNNYGHPHEEVVARLRDVGFEVLRTDESGDVIFEIYPDRVKLKN